MSIEWIDPVEEFEYTPLETAVSAAHQAEKLAACGVDAGVFGEALDPAFAIAIAIHAGIQSGITAEGNVNMVQRLIQHRPARLDEPLVVRGRIVRVDRVPRGRVVHTDAWFEDASGERVISAPRQSLKPDPAAGAARGAGERPPPVVDDVSSLPVHQSYTLTPDRVKAYSMEGNSIHYEQRAAERAGFRAPIIGGGMGVHYLTAWLWQQGAVAAFESDIYFRRPIFWDETVVVAGHDAALVLCKGEKAGTEMAVSNVQRY